MLFESRIIFKFGRAWSKDILLVSSTVKHTYLGRARSKHTKFGRDGRIIPIFSQDCRTIKRAPRSGDKVSEEPDTCDKYYTRHNQKLIKGGVKLKSSRDEEK